MTTKTRSFQTIGLDWLWSNFALVPVPGSAAFQTTFSLALPPQVSGKFFSSVRPRPVGPRQPGQVSPARSEAGTNSRAADKAANALMADSRRGTARRSAGGIVRVMIWTGAESERTSVTAAGVAFARRAGQNHVERF